MKTIVIGSLIFIALLAASNIAAMQKFLARRSVPLAAYSTLVPTPFNVAYKFNTGNFRNLQISSNVDFAIVLNNIPIYCSILQGEQLIPKNFVKTGGNSQSYDVIAKCIDKGVVWNEIYVVRNTRLTEVRVAGGIWG